MKLIDFVKGLAARLPSEGFTLQELHSFGVETLCWPPCLSARTLQMALEESGLFLYLGEDHYVWAPPKAAAQAPPQAPSAASAAHREAPASVSEESVSLGLEERGEKRRGGRGRTRAQLGKEAVCPRSLEEAEQLSRRADRDRVAVRQKMWQRLITQIDAYCPELTLKSEANAAVDEAVALNGAAVPKGAQDAPKSAQDAPKSAQDAPKSAQAAPKSVQDAPKSAQVAPKSAQAAPKSSDFVPMRVYTLSRALKVSHAEVLEKCAELQIPVRSYMSTLKGPQVVRLLAAFPGQAQSAQDTLQSAQAAPQSAQAAPQSAQAAPQSAQAAPQSAQDAPQSAQDAPQSAQDAPQSAQAAPQSEADAAPRAHVEARWGLSQPWPNDRRRPQGPGSLRDWPRLALLAEQLREAGFAFSRAQAHALLTEHGLSTGGLIAEIRRFDAQRDAQGLRPLFELQGQAGAAAPDEAAVKRIALVEFALSKRIVQLERELFSYQAQLQESVSRDLLERVAALEEGLFLRIFAQWAQGQGLALPENLTSKGGTRTALLSAERAASGEPIVLLVSYALKAPTLKLLEALARWGAQEGAAQAWYVTLGSADEALLARARQLNVRVVQGEAFAHALVALGVGVRTQSLAVPLIDPLYFRTLSRAD